MAAVIVRFIDGKGFVSQAITRLTNSLFSHVEFGTPQGTWIGAHIDGGVQERVSNYCIPTREYVYHIPIPDSYEAGWLAKLRSRIGTPYNTLDIVGIMLRNRRLTTPHRLICSQFFCEMMLDGFGASRFLNVLSDYSYLITPETAHLSPLLVGCLVKRVG